MAWAELLLAFLVAAMSVALTWRIALWAAARGLVDVPNERSSHDRPTPRGGGLAIVATVLAASVFAALSGWLPIVAVSALAVGGAVVSFAGYLDDRGGLSVRARLAAHLSAAVVAVAALDAVMATAVLPQLPHVAGFGILVVGIVWSINLFNFMDGIDGIAASQAIFVAIGSAVLIATLGDAATPWLALPLSTAGACVGFLIWNWPPARIFMGDVGSGFLGFWLAAMALALHGAGLLSIWTSAVLGSAFISDATVTLLRRALRGERLYAAHRAHAYQQLARRWASHRRVTIGLWAVNIAVVLPLAAWSAVAPQAAPAIAAVTLTCFGVVVLLAGAGARST